MILIFEKTVTMLATLVSMLDVKRKANGVITSAVCKILVSYFTSLHAVTFIRVFLEPSSVHETSITCSGLIILQSNYHTLFFIFS